MKNHLELKLTFILLIISFVNAHAQLNSKFLKVDFVGAMGIKDWTKGWTNWNPEQTDYPSVNEIITLNAATKDSGKIEIKTDITLDAHKVYLLTAIIYIKKGGSLTIPAGTIIRAEANKTAIPANWATIVVQRGGKINCLGTVDKPVVFTSNKKKGNRDRSDWGGIILLGKAINNSPGGQENCKTCLNGEAIIEGPFGTESIFGGNDDTDNSGIITYTRIEFPGLDFTTNNEINGLTLGSVGSGTLLKYIQVSFSNDDSYEWLGGTVNSKYLIAFRGTDDDFDTDMGYRGMNQFGIGVKDSIHFDPTWVFGGSNTSEGFESDNDATGSNAKPKTQAVFCNYTMVGPWSVGEAYSQHSTTIRGSFRRGARIRRNSGLSILNSLFIGYRNPVMIDGAKTEAVANVINLITDCDTLEVRNNIILSLPGSPQSLTANSIIEVSSGRDTSLVYKWLKASANRINPVAWKLGTLLTDPNNYTNPNFLPVVGSPALSGADFTNCKLRDTFATKVGIIKSNSSIKLYPNPCSGTANVEMNLLNHANLNISVIALDGKVIRNLNDSYPAGKSMVTFDGLSQGVYIVKVAQDASFNTFKLIVK